MAHFLTVIALNVLSCIDFDSQNRAFFLIFSTTFLLFLSFIFSDIQSRLQTYFGLYIDRFLSQPLLELTTNAISKNPIVYKIFSKKFFKFSLYHQSLGLKAMFILMPTLCYLFAEKQSGKKDMIGSCGAGGLKMVFKLLVKTIAIKVQLLIIKVGKPSLDGLLSKFWLVLGRRLSLSL